MALIGIDTGGTFTDFVNLDPSTGSISIVKVPSTPNRPSEAPISALTQSNVDFSSVERVVIGTTIATNARLQKQGSTVIYVGTMGHQDVPIIGRIDRKEAYNPSWRKPDSGVLRRHCFGIDERIDHKGVVLNKLTHKELRRFGSWIKQLIAGSSEAEWSIAVNLLFS